MKDASYCKARKSDLLVLTKVRSSGQGAPVSRTAGVNPTKVQYHNLSPSLGAQTAQTEKEGRGQWALLAALLIVVRKRKDGLAPESCGECRRPLSGLVLA